MPKLIDLTGQRFGKLVVLRRDTLPHKRKGAFWLCKCDCENEKSINSVNLLKGYANSCGCVSTKKKHFIGEVIKNIKLLKHVQSGRWLGECLVCGNVRELNPAECNIGYCQKCMWHGKPRRVWNAPFKSKKLRDSFTSYQRGAERRGYNFLLLPQDFENLCLSTCHYCGDEPHPYNGIDRVDNHVGYTKENCVSCCSMCNWMKNKQTKEDFLNQCKKIAEYQELKKEISSMELSINNKTRSKLCQDVVA